MKFFLYLVLKSALTKVYQMNVNKLDRFEIENIEDCLPLFEKTFNIQLENVVANFRATPTSKQK